MKLAHFRSQEAVMPHVGFVETATRDFRAGNEDVEWIECNAAGTLVIVRRSRRPDLYFTAMGYGTLLGDSETVPGNRAGNPEEAEKRKKVK